MLYNLNRCQFLLNTIAHVKREVEMGNMHIRQHFGTNYGAYQIMCHGLLPMKSGLDFSNLHMYYNERNE